MTSHPDPTKMTLRTAAALIASTLALTAPAVQAGTYMIARASDCSLMGTKPLFDLINEVGLATNLDLKSDMRIAGVLRCFQHPSLTQAGSPVYPYTFRATIEKQVMDGGRMQWLPVAEQTSFGISDGTGPWHEELRRTTRNLIQQLR